jgi:hypothetical protein
MMLRELIDKLQEAPCGDPMLDFWVWWWGEEAGPRGDEPEETFANERILSFAAPQFSSSIDIAARLVPEGYEWRTEKKDGRAIAVVTPPSGNVLVQTITANNPALALCAAALRCRMSYACEVMRGRQ